MKWKLNWVVLSSDITQHSLYTKLPTHDSGKQSRLGMAEGTY